MALDYIRWTFRNIKKDESIRSTSEQGSEPLNIGTLCEQNRSSQEQEIPTVSVVKALVHGPCW